MRCLSVGLMVTCLPAMAGTTYVVSPHGDDANAGTEAAPFRTIQQAAARLQPGDTCLVRAGTYRETVRPAASGTAAQPIEIRNWPGERPRLVGTDPVAGWRGETGNVWSAPLPWTLGKNNQVFVDGQPGQEARWPDKHSDDPLDWDACAFDKGSRNDYLICRKLPDRPDGYWNGATLWGLAGAKWTSWSTRVTGYSNAEKKLRFSLPPKQGSIQTHMSPADRRGGFFYLVGVKGEINTPGEWVIDEEAKRLHVCVADGRDPSTMAIEAKRRKHAVDLSDRSHITVAGFEVLGADLALNHATHCTVRDVHATWIGHTRGGATGYSLGETIGITISGEYNTIRDCEIAYSAGNGIKLSGRRNAVINCWIHHTDYTACYDAPVRTWGEQMLISHNTIHDTGRDCIQPAGQGHIIEYNHIFHMGRLAHDLGASYVCGSDGGGTEFRYNWCHSNLAHGTRMGIYLDNFTSNYFVYGNVVWDIRGCDIRLNRPSFCNVVVNNTMMGKTGNWGRWKTDWMYACAYVNNAVSEAIEPHPQAVFAGNRFKIPATDLNPGTFQAFRGTDPGAVPIPGITEDTPGLGAYSDARPDWRAGHDFANPPDAAYRPAETPLRNLVQHGSFDWIRWRGKLGPWTPVGDGTVGIVWGPGGISKSYTTRDTIIGAGAKIEGPAGTGMEQSITGLRPRQTYELLAWVKTDGEASVRLELVGKDGVLSTAAAETPAEWTLLQGRFTTGGTVGDATVRITNTAAGTAFVDDVALVGVINGIEPRLPGFAPVAKAPAPKPVPVRHATPLSVPAVVRAPTVDGAIGAEEYPADAIPVRDSPGRTRAPGPECQAWLAHREGILYVAVRVPLIQPLQPSAEPRWTKSDGAEVCIACPDRNARHPIYVLHGFPNGICEGSPEAGAPGPEARALAGAATYAATVAQQAWTAEWAIPLAAIDIEAPAGLELLFNLGIFRRESKQWIQWGGTRAQTWRVDRAGRIRLDNG